MIRANVLNASITASLAVQPEFTGACLTGNTSQTTTIDQTRIEADAYRSLTALDLSVWCPKGHATADSRTSADDQLRLFKTGQFGPT